MDEKLLQRLSDLAVAYSKHRSEWWTNSRAIRAVHDDADGYIDLAPFRNRYLSGEVQDLELGECIVWHGWLHAVNTCQEWDQKEFDGDCAFIAMAILLDQRKAIKAEGGKIRNKLRLIGEQILRAAK